MMNIYLFDMTDKKVTKHRSHLQVNIKYPSGNRTINVDDKNIASVIINLAHGIYCTAFKLALENEERRKIIEDMFLTIMDKECQEMCKKKSNCVLKNTGVHGLTNFQLSKFEKEFKCMAPLTSKTLASVCHSNRSRKATCNPNVVSTIGAIILFSRCPQMSVFAYRLGFIMRHAGAGTMVCV